MQTNKHHLQVAAIIRDQLFSLDKNLLWAIGANTFLGGTDEKGQSFLRFRTSGSKGQFYVQITLDEGLDLYNVKIFRVRHDQSTGEVTKEVEYQIEEVYAEDLPGILEEHCW